MFFKKHKIKKYFLSLSIIAIIFIIIFQMISIIILKKYNKITIFEKLFTKKEVNDTKNIYHDSYAQKNKNDLKEIINIDFKKNIKNKINNNVFNFLKIQKQICQQKKIENDILKKHCKNNFIQKDIFYDEKNTNKIIYIYNFHLEGQTNSKAVIELLNNLGKFGMDIKWENFKNNCFFEGYNKNIYENCKFKLKQNPVGLQAFYFYDEQEREGINNEYNFYELFLQHKKETETIFFLFWHNKINYNNFFLPLIKIYKNLNISNDKILNFNIKEISLLDCLQQKEQENFNLQSKINFLMNMIIQSTNDINQKQKEINVLIQKNKKNQAEIFLLKYDNKFLSNDNNNLKTKKIKTQLQTSNLQKNKEFFIIQNLIKEYDDKTAIVEYQEALEKYNQYICYWKIEANIKPNIQYNFTEFLNILTQTENVYHNIIQDNKSIIITIFKNKDIYDQKISQEKIKIFKIKKINQNSEIKINNTVYNQMSDIKFQSNVFLSLEKPLLKPHNQEFKFINKYFKNNECENESNNTLIPKETNYNKSLSNNYNNKKNMAIIDIFLINKKDLIKNQITKNRLSNYSLTAPCYTNQEGENSLYFFIKDPPINLLAVVFDKGNRDGKDDTYTLEDLKNMGYEAEKMYIFWKQN
ncbi:putative telomere resolvase [Candidatus Phytoplasma mali]|uniref:Putative telomere resolvase n=1 Tax=Phytoplasma mali (strain AT) TaxID=482235 RepID=B3R0C6_PHYMT|nr:hypothetical protein [Candidatus Phytoplasma mali]CAP18290.1 putative telomere resolvase [Candidatus Phytoplasma mali]